MDRIKAYFESIINKKVAFCGLGITNIPLIRQFANKGISVIACDKTPFENLDDEAKALAKLGVEFRTGGDYLENLDADIIFRTPGMYYNSKELMQYREKGVLVTSEMEVFFSLCPAKTIAVTGSDGKTTTATLIFEMLLKQGYNVFLGGNIGTPLLPTIEKMTENDFAVVELSSFQLISMKPCPDIAVITNISPNHLDVHSSMEEYVDAKKNIFMFQKPNSKTVLNADDPIVSEIKNETKGVAIFFSRIKEQENGSFCDVNGDIFLCGEKIINKSEIILIGDHNVSNYITAIAAVQGLVEPGVMRDVARTFKGIEHRIEFVREVNGVKYYNHSIATSPQRTIAGLKAFSQKIILIAGGSDKNLSYDPLAPYIIDKVKILILTGATADKIENAVKNHTEYKENKPGIIKASDMQMAVLKAHEKAEAGDIVSLSPASASFDSYKNFEYRGRHFKDIVMRI